MKKFFIIILTLVIAFFIANSSLAQEKHNINLTQNENYLILLNFPVAEIMANDAEAMKTEILTTLYNEKNQVTVKPMKEGIFRLYITFEDNDFVILSINSTTNNIDFLNTPKSQKIKTILKIDAVEKKEEKQPQKKEQLKLDQPPLFKPKLREAH